MSEQFEWTSPAGVTITLPPASSIKSRLLRKYRKLDEMDMMFSILEDIVDEDTLDRIDDLDQNETSDLFESWQKASMGESKRSSS